MLIYLRFITFMYVINQTYKFDIDFFCNCVKIMLGFKSFIKSFHEIREKNVKAKLISIVLLVSIFLTGCSAESKIIGTWVDADGVNYEFFKDGTVTIESYGIVVSGNYEFIDGDTMKLNLDGLWGLGGASVFDVKISGKELALTTSGQTIYLEKAN